jgi:predicted nucleotide-binding protein
VPYYHIYISREGVDYREFDQSETSVKKLSEFYLKGERLLFCGRTFDPFEINVVRVYATEKRREDYLSEVWQVGADVTRDFITSPPTESQKALKVSSGKKALSKNIFIIHGNDHEPMKELKSMLYEFGLNPIVLFEQASGGSSTVAEKLEKYAKDVGYAFAILTPDDIGGQRVSMRKRLGTDTSWLPAPRPVLVTEGLIDGILNHFEPRARQNVIFEMGYFWGLLERKRVCCLLKGEIQKPSDTEGIVYIRFVNSVEEIRLKIMKELKEVSYELRF